MRRALFAAFLLPLSSCHGCSDDPDAVRALSPIADFWHDEDGRVIGMSAGVKGISIMDDSHLAHLPKLPRLKIVVMAGASVSDAGLKSLADCSRLEELGIHFCGITDNGLEPLFRLKRLRKVEIRQTQVTDAGLRRLREALPDAEVNGVRPAGH